MIDSKVLLPGIALLTVATVFIATAPKPKDRIKTIIDSVLHKEEFQNLWLEANRNLHSSIKIYSSTKDNQASLHPTTCRTKTGEFISSCVTKSPGTHSFNIYINQNGTRTDSQILYSIIFELCNATMWQKHLDIRQKAKDHTADIEALTTRSEKLEWKAMKKAKIIAAALDPSFEKSVARDLEPLESLDSCLAIQKARGHYQSIKTTLENIRSRP